MMIAAGKTDDVTIINDYYKFIETFINDKNDDSISLSYTNKNVNMINELTRYERRAKELEKNDLPFIEDDIIIMQDRFSANGIVFQNNEEIIVKKAELKKEKFKFWRVYPKDVEGYVDIIHKDSEDDYKKQLNLLSTSAKYEKDREKRTKLWKGFYILKEKFADIKYHYASTIHKSQGSSHSNVYLDLKSLDWVESEMRTRLIYVAISRVTKGLVIHY